MVVLQVKEKNEEFEEIVFRRCQKKHLAMDYPLDSPTIFGRCDLNHFTDHCPSLPRMEETYQGDLGVAGNSLQQSWQPWSICMVQNYIPPFPYSHTQSLNTPPPWQLSESVEIL